jgi:hypothetical protein
MAAKRIISIKNTCLANTETYEPPACGEFVISTSPSFKSFPWSFIWYFTALRRNEYYTRKVVAGRTHKLIEPKWIGMNGALATRSPSGANKAHEKSSLSLMLVLIDVCCRDRPIASATLMKRLANRVKRIGSGPLDVGLLLSLRLDMSRE